MEQELDPELDADERERVSKLSNDEVEFLDRVLLAEILPTRWRKLAAVVGWAMDRVEQRVPGVPCGYLAERVRRLVALGNVEAQGNLHRMRFSEVQPAPGDQPVEHDMVLGEDGEAPTRLHDASAAELVARHVADPGDLRQWLKLGQRVARMGDYTRAVIVGGLARERFGDAVLPLSQIASWEARAGRYLDAIATYDRLETSADTGEWNSLRDMVCLFRGFCRVQVGRTRAAAADALACGHRGDVYFCGLRISRAWLEVQVRKAR